MNIRIVARYNLRVEQISTLVKKFEGAKITYHTEKSVKPINDDIVIIAQQLFGENPIVAVKIGEGPIYKFTDWNSIFYNKD